MRRLLLTLLVLLLLGLPGCGKEQDNPGTTEAIYHSDTSSQDCYLCGDGIENSIPFYCGQNNIGDINGLDYWDNPDGLEPAGDDSWLPPTDEGLANSQWNCGEGWYMELGKGNCDPNYAGTADLYYQFEDEQEYQLFYFGVWRMEGDCLRLELSAGMGTSASGSFPVLIDPSGDHLYIQQSKPGQPGKRGNRDQ